jgi:hypothetical protein
MQTKFKPRKDDLEKILKLKQETKPSILTNNVPLSKAAFDFLIGIAEQHARISDITLTALEKHDDITDRLEMCQALYLVLAAEVGAISHLGDKERLKHRVQDVLKGIVDWRVVSMLFEDIEKRKPSTLADILEARGTRINKALAHANKMKEYNQPNPTPQKTKKKGIDHDR